MVSSAYLILLIFLLAILIQACASSSLAFHMMYSAYKLNKQDDNIQSCTPFPIWNQSIHCSMSSSNCCFLICIQISQEAVKMVWYERMKSLSQSENMAQFVAGDESKIRCCKEQYHIGTWNARSMNQGKLKVVKQEMARVNTDILGISELK